MFVIRKFFIAFIATLGTAIPAASQTVLINSGYDSSGAVVYIRAYEYDCVDEKPCFPGGDDKLDDFVKTNRKYPAEAYRRGIQGRVACQFVVNTDGSISNLSLLKSVHTLLDNEALRVLSMMPKWTPGKIDGKPVPVRVIQFVKFRK